MEQFKHIESYKHSFAKLTLKGWFESDYDCRFEEKFYIDGILSFVPDLTLISNNRIMAVYEVVHKHGIDGKKLGVIQSWCYRNYDFPVYEINADFILNQIDKPPIVGYEIIVETDKYETTTWY